MSLPHPPLPEAPDAPQPRLPVRLLLVDDDVITCTVLSHYLHQENYTVATAGTATEGLRLFDDFGPDILCLDYALPDMSGNALARHIRARPDSLYIPILMLTGSGENLKLESLESGVDAFLTKPVRPVELKITLQTLVRIKDALDRVADATNLQLGVAPGAHQNRATPNSTDALIDELQPPLRMAQDAAQHLRALNPRDGAQQHYITQIKTALNQVHTLLQQQRAWDR